MTDDEYVPYYQEQCEEQKEEHDCEWEADADGYVSCGICGRPHPDNIEDLDDTPCLEDRGYRNEG